MKNYYIKLLLNDLYGVFYSEGIKDYKVFEGTEEECEEYIINKRK